MSLHPISWKYCFTKIYRKLPFFKIKKIHEHAAYRFNSVFWKGTAAAADVTAAAADINAAAAADANAASAAKC